MYSKLSFSPYPSKALYRRRKHTRFRYRSRVGEPARVALEFLPAFLCRTRARSRLGSFLTIGGQFSVIANGTDGQSQEEPREQRPRARRPDKILRSPRIRLGQRGDLCRGHAPRFVRGQSTASALLLQLPRTAALAASPVHGGTGQRLARRNRE